MSKQFNIYIQTRGYQYSFRINAYTAEVIQQAMVNGSRFVWIAEKQAINLDNVEHIQFEEVKE